MHLMFKFGENIRKTLHQQGQQLDSNMSNAHHEENITILLDRNYLKVN